MYLLHSTYDDSSQDVSQVYLYSNAFLNNSEIVTQY